MEGTVANFRSDDLVWKGNKLQLRSLRQTVVEIMPDQVYPKMWRVRDTDGALSDMVNLTRAKDAAMSIAPAHLNTKLAQAV
jgi:hypothetical protein